MTNLPFNGKFKVTCEYGRKNTQKTKWAAGFHTGMDLVGSESKDVYNVCDGTVIMSAWYGDYGNAVKVRDDKTGYIFLFAHLAKRYVKKGAKVNRGTKIGLMGSTGNSTGPHLHIEMRKPSDVYGVVENIADYMRIPNKVGEYNSVSYHIENDITYEVHVESIGWQAQRKDWEIAGTEGESKRIEAIKIMADIPLKYRVHMAEKGWGDWVTNGEIAGTVGESRRIEAIEIMADREIKAAVHVENKGWLPEVKGKHIQVGTVGEALRLEALRLEIV